jgi:ribosome biogenesis GTPase
LRRPLISAPAGTRAGLVTVAHGSECVVEAGDELIRCRLRRRRGARPVCGDRVRWQPTAPGEGVIEAIEPRRSLIERGDFRGRPRPLAANVDRMVIVLAEPPGVEPLLLDRYLVLARHMGIPASAWLNKVDRLTPAAGARLHALLDAYRPQLADIGEGSAHRGEGLDELKRRLADHCAILVGLSGVGKSSLVNALVPDLALRIGALSAASGQGRHTTTTTTLFRLPGGGCLIDSPGVRTLRLDHLPADAVHAGFPEIQAELGHCRFRDCRHQRDAGCAVLAALEAGRITPERLESWRGLLEETAGGD